MGKKKVLLVSMGNLHFFRWCEVLNTSEIDFYWFDVLDGGSYAHRIGHIQQIYGWKYHLDYPFRYTVKKYFPSLYHFISKFNDRDTGKVFDKIIRSLKPDLVHSFELFISCEPIFNSMITNDITWVYSSWGSDVYYAAQHKKSRLQLNQILTRVDFLITDCERDLKICREEGFKGEFLGVIPGGTGVNIEQLQVEKEKWFDRKLILVKGYQGKYGRCIEILKALSQFSTELKAFQILVFFAHEEVRTYIDNNNLNLNISYNSGMAHSDLISCMLQSWLYIGNSISDGIPNTLIEAAVCGCLPVQSNPGNATAEIIDHGYNGFLIEYPEDIHHIKEVIKLAISKRTSYEEGLLYNSNNLSKRYNRTLIAQKINSTYFQLLNNDR